MASVRQFLDLTNCTIRFTTYEGEYEGVIRLVCPVNQRLIVERIYFLPDRIYMGTLRFFCNEIYDFKVISRPDAVNPEKVDLHACARKYESRQTDALDLFDEYDDSDIISIGTAADQEFPEEQYVLRLPPKFDNLPLDVVAIDSIGQEFLQAVNHIKSAACIGISLEGPKSGRHGIISWFCVSTSSCTFLFDVQELGVKVFENGLREILENPSIEKVVHDCREVSDCLFHMYNTRLVNVFDTQVADKLVTMQKSRDGKFNKHVDSLNSCLRNYLSVPEEFLYRNKLSEAYHHRVLSFQLRPSPSELQDIMVKNVIYLQSLKNKLQQEMMNPFKRAVEVYLQVLQCASDQELLLDPSVPDQVPSELMLEGIQIVRFKEHLEMPSVVASGPPFRKTKNPIKHFLEHCTNINDKANTSPDNDLKSVEESVPVTNYVQSELTKVNEERLEGQKDFKLDERVSYGSADTKVTAVVSKSLITDISVNSKVNVKNNLEPRVADYSRRELDKMYFTECSKVSLDDEKILKNREKRNENSSRVDESDDPWAAFREEFSKLHGPIANDPEMKRRFVPAGIA